jgi:hypothetical protein
MQRVLMQVRVHASLGITAGMWSGRSLLLAQVAELFEQHLQAFEIFAILSPHHRRDEWRNEGGEAGWGCPPQKVRRHIKRCSFRERR